MKDALPHVLQPAHWPRPKGYSHGMAASGRMVFVAGQVGWDGAGHFASERLADQVKVALENIVTVLAEAGARPEHVTRLGLVRDESRRTTTVDLKEIGANYRAVMGRTLSGHERRAGGRAHGIPGQG